MKHLIVILAVVLLLATACRPVQRLPEAAGAQTPEAILQQIMALDPQAPDYAERMVATYAPGGDLTLIFSPGNEDYLRGPDVLLAHYKVTGAENFRMQPGDITVAGNTITSRGQTEMTGAPPFPTELVLELENGLVKHATWRVLGTDTAQPATAKAAVIRRAIMYQS